MYPNRRARFTVYREKKRIDIFPVNRENDDYKDMMKFELYLYAHPNALDEYKKIKESSNGVSVREYYCKKLEFINAILRS